MKLLFPIVQITLRQIIYYKNYWPETGCLILEFWVINLKELMSNSNSSNQNGLLKKLYFKNKWYICMFLRLNNWITYLCKNNVFELCSIWSSFLLICRISIKLLLINFISKTSFVQLFPSFRFETFENGESLDPASVSSNSLYGIVFTLRC